jgi:hypothetical protein
MQAIRATVMVCVTSLVILAGVLVYLNQQDRYLVMPQDKSIFVFDRKSALINYCTANSCQLVMPQGFNDAPQMNVVMSPNGQFAVQPTSQTMGMPFNQGMVGMMPMREPFTSSLQTYPKGFNPMMNVTPAGMQGQQMVMVPSPIVPTAMPNSVKPHSASSAQPTTVEAQPKNAPEASALENAEGAEGSADAGEEAPSA